MLKAILGLGALLGLCYAIADKKMIAQYRRDANRWAVPFCLIALGFAAWVFLAS